MDKLSFHALTPERWSDLERLFGERGACGGCWCMFWRVPRKAFEASKGAGNKRSFRNLVKRGKEPGILAYARSEPVGWCAIAPREEYVALERSRLLQPIDEKPVWSVSCFFIKRPYRRRGLSVKLLQAAVGFAAKRGAKIVEGYPAEPSNDKVADPFLWHGVAAAFKKAGFKEVVRRAPTRPIMRYQVEAKSKGRARSRGQGRREDYLTFDV